MLGIGRGKTLAPPGIWLHQELLHQELLHQALAESWPLARDVLDTEGVLVVIHDLGYGQICTFDNCLNFYFALSAPTYQATRYGRPDKARQTQHVSTYTSCLFHLQ